LHRCSGEDIIINNERLRFLKNLLIYVGGALSIQGISALALPLWILYFSPTEYGIFALLHTCQTIGAMAIGLNLGHVFIMHYCHTAADKKRELIRHIYGVLFLSNLFWLLALIPFYSVLCSYLFDNTLSPFYLFLGIVVASLNSIKTLSFLYLQQTEQPHAFTTLHLFENSSYLCIMLIGVILFDGRIGAILIAQLCSSLSTLALIVWREKPELQGPLPSLSITKKYLVEGGSMYPLLVSTHLFTIGDRLVMKHFTNLHAVGLYAFANKFTDLFLTLFITPLRRTYIPYIQRQYKQALNQGYAENSWHLACYIGLGVIALCGAFFIGKPLLVYFVPSRFHQALPYLFCLAPSAVICGAFVFCNSLHWYTKNTVLLTKLLTAAATGNVVLNCLLVTRWGGFGCAFSTLVCNAAYFTSAWYFHRRTFQHLHTPDETSLPMKILHFIDSLKSGGTPTVFKTVIEGLHKEDQTVEHVVAYLHDGPVRNELEKQGVRTIHLSPLFSRYDITLLPRFMNIIRGERPHVTHTAMTNALFFGRLASWLMRVPNVSGVHEDMNYVGRFSQYGMRVMGGMATRYIAITQQAKDTLLTFQKKSFQPAHIDVVYNGLDLPLIRQQAAADPVTRQSIGLADDAFVVGGVGRFSPEKSFDVLIKSFAKLKSASSQKVQLCLVGYGPQEQEFRQLCHSLGIAHDVIFAGHQSNPFPFYSLFDAFVLSSQTEGGTALVLLEAMVFGVPVITTHDRDTHETITDGVDGYFVPVNDTAAIANRLQLLLTNVELRSRLGEAGKQLVEQNYSADIMAKQYLAVFTKTANSRKEKA
jgi:glycosyltransferase involved in cell wall biosynthesis/O-antigen/teichoic acid export membrane protein